jgi:hypothetical protein
MNPALVEMAAQDRIAELRRTAARRPLATRSYLTAPTTLSQPPRSSIGRAPRTDAEQARTNPQQAVGWFLVSVGLRLALPRARAASNR